jgi:hypothetical protein
VTIFVLDMLCLAGASCRSRDKIFEQPSPDGRYGVLVEEGNIEHDSSDFFTYVSVKSPSGWRQLMGEEIGQAAVLFGLASWSSDSSRVSLLLCTNPGGTQSFAYDFRTGKVSKPESLARELELAIENQYGESIRRFPAGCTRLCWICSAEATHAFRRRHGLSLAGTSNPETSAWSVRFDLNRLCSQKQGCEASNRSGAAEARK